MTSLFRELDALSRHRALTDEESAALEREMHRPSNPGIASRSRSRFDQALAESRALKRVQDELIAELEARGASAAVVQYVLCDLLANRLTLKQIAQRIRNAKERTERHKEQRREKPELLRRCVNAYEAMCAYCDRAGTTDADPDGKKWELDRIYPGYLGGEYKASNVALACHACNQKKGTNVTFRPPLSLSKMEAA